LDGLGTTADEPALDIGGGRVGRPGDDLVRSIVADRLINSHFQPIVDLHHGSAIAWEVLSRGPEAMQSPAEIFARAEQLGLLSDLETVCRERALETISRLPAEQRSRLFFLNVSPNVIGDPRVLNGHMQEKLAGLGLDQRNIVIEITERESIMDYGAFERQIRHYVDKGFKIALDDLGAGHSGLVTLVTCSPHFMKLDMSLSRDIHRHSYKQHLVKSLIAFTASVDAALIAEGVETWEELETLARLGVRYAQGFLFARPARLPAESPPEVRTELRRVMRQFNYRESDLNETVGPLVIRCATIHERQKRGEDVDRTFRREPGLDHMVIVRDERPVGLITRQHYYFRTGGPVGYHLFQWKPAEDLARRAPLIVEDSINVTALAKLAMERPPDELYDPVIVTDAGGRLIGTVTIRQLLMRSTALEVQSAQGSSPLTGLPGNRSIERWILNALDQPSACVLYADLDRFKEYNDCYGFLRGDEMIRCLARVLSRALPGLSADAKLGHIGGDDFVIVAPSGVDPENVARLCAQFDAGKIDLFAPSDVERGFFRATDRRGQEVSVPLITLSVAVVPSESVSGTDHPGALAQMAASLKRKVKETSSASGKSAFLFERRRLQPAAP
jgi:EAL domain-containing protein (putative c-di-GMP-specific phosphodiesterase class I)/GGDEF domain-containing protein